jgi:hypothetical protein
MMEAPNLAAPHPAKEALGFVRASDALAVGFLVIDAEHLKALMQIVARSGLIGKERRAAIDARADEAKRLGLGARAALQRPAAWSTGYRRAGDPCGDRPASHTAETAAREIRA